MRNPCILSGPPVLILKAALPILLIVMVAVAQEPGSTQYTVKPLPLPGAKGLVMLDYFA